MREELQNVYPFVKKWAESQGCDYECYVSAIGEMVMANDYTEYTLSVGVFNEPRLEAVNVEMVMATIWNVPVPDNEERFLALMDVLNNPEWSPRTGEVEILVERGVLCNNEFARQHAGQPENR